jgi:glycosyltransferase involved in cell wall biosynthesis
MIDYSIIIPHKNSPSLLIRCLDSIPQRDDLEVIVVDDNSDPSIVNFDNFPGINRPNTFCLFNKENGGAGLCRNLGLMQAKGKWLLFADADDYYSQNLNILLDKYKNVEDIDIVYFNAIIVDENREEKNGYWQKLFDDYAKGKYYSEKRLRYLLWTPWTRMVRRKIVEKNHIKYEEIPVGNDMKFCLECSYFAKRMNVFHNSIYNYYKPIIGSITDKAYTVENFASRMQNNISANILYKKARFWIKASNIFMLCYQIKQTPQYSDDYIKLYLRTMRKLKQSIILDTWRGLVRGLLHAIHWVD